MLALLALKAAGSAGALAMTYVAGLGLVAVREGITDGRSAPTFRSMVDRPGAIKSLGEVIAVVRVGQTIALVSILAAIWWPT